MTKILIDEATVKLALSALEAKDGWGSSIREAKEKAITALKALAEQPAQQEPESECNPQDLCAGCRCKYAAQPAQTQQEPVSVEHCVWARNGNSPCPHTTPQPAQQEPVAYAEQSILDWLASSARGPTAYAKTTLAKRQDGKAQAPLYTTTPPAQRTWVNATTWRGLTEEEMAEIVEGCDNIGWDVAPAIEAKLKEKNT